MSRWLLLTISAGNVWFDPMMLDTMILSTVELVLTVTLIESTAKKPQSSPSWPQSSSAWDRTMRKLTAAATFVVVVEDKL